MAPIRPSATFPRVREKGKTCAPDKAPAPRVLDAVQHVARKPPPTRAIAFRSRKQQRTQTGETVRAHHAGANQFAERVFQFHFQQTRAVGDFAEERSAMLSEK